MEVSQIKTITIEDLLNFIDSNHLHYRLIDYLIFHENLTYDEAKETLKQIGLSDEND